jgi:hypothetical protein
MSATLPMGRWNCFFHAPKPIYPACLDSSQRISSKLSSDTTSNGVGMLQCWGQDTRPLVSQQAIPAAIRGANASRARGYTVRGNGWGKAFAWVRYISALTKGSEEPVQWVLYGWQCGPG